MTSTKIKNGCTCMPGKQKEAISHSLGLEIESKEKFAQMVESKNLKQMTKLEIIELQDIKKEIDELDYC